MGAFVIPDGGIPEEFGEEKSGIPGGGIPEGFGRKTGGIPEGGFEFLEPGGGKEPSFESTYKLRDWELKFATSQPYWEDRMDEDDSDPWGGWGDEQEGVHPYDLTRAVAEVLPAARYIFPSGRDAFMNKEWGGRTGEAGLEIAGLLPWFILGKGLKMTTGLIGKALTLPFKGAGKVIKTLPFSTKKIIFEQAPFLDEAMSQVVKYERIPAWEKAMKKYGISPEEGRQLIEERPLAAVMRIWGMGKDKVNVPVFGSKAFRKLFKKDGNVTDEVKKNLAKWAEPHEVQELAHYVREWEGMVRKLFKREYRPKDLWRLQMVRLFGEKGTKIKYGDVDIATVGKALRDILKTKPAKYLRDVDLAYGHYLPYHFLPSRIVFDTGERAYGAFSKVYLPAKKMFGNASTYSFVQTANFQVTMMSRGLGKLVKRGTGEYRWKEFYSSLEWEQAGVAITSLDEMARAGARTVEMQAVLDSLKSDNVRKIALSWLDFKDHLYKDYMGKKIWQEFEKIGLTEVGKDALVALMRGPKGVEKVLDATFAVGSNLTFKAKEKIARAMLGKAVGETSALKKNVSWFSTKTLKELRNPVNKKELGSLVERLKEAKKELSPMEKNSTKGFIPYLENYAMVVRDKGMRIASARSAALAGGKRHAGFTKPRKEIVGDDIGERTTELDRIIDGRIRMQAKELYVYPRLAGVVKVGETFPKKYRDYTEHYLSRMLGEPSDVDMSLAQWFTRVSGKVTDQRTVMDLAWRMNDLHYMAGLGLRPFSVMRNYFQPFLMTPADMGGIKDYYWLGKGFFKALTSPTHRKYIRSIGAIGEYAPELYLNPRVSNFGKRLTILGKTFTLPTIRAFREFTMFAFKHSDIHNRYVSGCAGITKWDELASRVLRKGDEWNLSTKNVERFMKKINVNSREYSIRGQIAGHLRTNTRVGFEEAKKVWTTSIIADSQWLYGRADAPIFSHTMGAFGRTAGIFQTWWMNYGAILEKWFFRTPGGVGPKSERIVNWITSGMVAEQLAQNIWAPRTAASLGLMGPFPLQLNEYMIPPTIAPIYHALNTVLAGSARLQGLASPEQFKRRYIALLKSSVMFIPMGLQAVDTWKAAKTDEDWALAKSIIRYNPEED